MRTNIFIHFFILLFLISCKDKEETTPAHPVIATEPEEPQIKIVTPSLNDHFDKGEDINIEANISDNKQVYITYVQIKDLNTNTVIYNPGEIHNHSKSFILNLSYNVSQSTSSRYLLILKVIDFDNKFTEKQVQLWVN